MFAIIFLSSSMTKSNMCAFAIDVNQTHPDTGRSRLIRTRLIQSSTFGKNPNFGKNPIISCLKCMVNSNTVNSKFHQFKVNLSGI